MLIGVSGRKRSGKDSIGAMLMEAYGFKRVAFADDVKALTARIFDWPLKWVVGDTFKESVVCGVNIDHQRQLSLPPRQGMHALLGRGVLQRIGNGVREVISDDTWIKLALAQCADQGLCSNCGNPKNGDTLQTMTLYHGAPVPYCHAEGSTPDEIFTSVKHYVITDVRYPNELAAIKAAGGLVIRTNRADRVDAHEFDSGDFDGTWGAATQEVYGRDYDATKCAWLIQRTRKPCDLPREAHPTHDSGDWHPSEVSLPDESNASVQYDAVFTGGQDANVSATRAFVAARLK